MRKNLLLVLILSFLGIHSFAQNFSNKGKEFWLAYSYHVGMVNNTGGAPSMTLNITSDVTTTYTVEIFGGPVISTGTIIANGVNNVTIPNTYFINGDGTFNNKAIHITAVSPIVVYSFITRAQASAATLCLPTNVLGKQYYAMSYTQVSNEANSASYITIVGVEDNTSVEIIPTAPTQGGWAIGSVNTINLNRGQVYQVLGTTTGNNGVDLSGTSIRSIASGTSGCKRIAVFSGSGKLSLGCNGGSADNLYQQLYPVASWGKSFLTAPSFGRTNNFYRILRSSPTANVFLNGVLIPSASFTNGYYQFNNTLFNKITADLPISVTQYFTSQGCLGNVSPYDPDMIVLNPVEQNINKVTLVSSNLLAANTAHQHHLHIIMKNQGTAISSFRFDNAPIPATATWLPHPNDPTYSYLYLSNVTETSHSLASDSGFNALAYGYSNAETYGYSAGTNVKDLYQQIGVSTQYGIETSPSVCTGAPFKFKISLPYEPLQLDWNFNGQQTNTSQVGVAGQPLANDSVTVVNGRTIYWYSLPTFYTYNTVGVFPVNITATTSGTDGCGSLQEINFDLEVSNPPVAGFTFNQPGCIAETVQFQDATATVKPNYKWYWDFGDPASGAANFSNLQNPTHVFATTGPHIVRFASITTPGCLSDTLSQTVNVPANLTASISGGSTICQNATGPNIVFSGTGGIPPYTFTYTINGGAAQTISTIGSATTVTLAAPTSTPGSFVYTLTNVQNTGSSICSFPVSGASTTVVVNPLPTATITGTTAVCQNTTAPNITFTGANGTAPYTFTYTINGGANQTVSTVSGNSVTVAAPTNTVGTFTYALVSVKDASVTQCTQTATGNAVVQVQAVSTATITGNATVCQNATAPIVTFTATNGNAPFTFTYNINGGATQTITTGATSNVATLSVPMTTSGTFVYNLLSVSNTGPTTCVTPITGSNITVRINPVPTAAITGNATVCQNATAPLVTFTAANGTAPYTFTYNINGGANQTITTTSGNSVSVNAPTNVAGTYAYNLISVVDASSTLCTQTQAGTATIIVNPLPTATIAGSTEVCLNAVAPNVTFTAAGGVAPYTFTYNINGGANQTVTTTTGNSVTVAVPTSVAGTFNYNLVSVRESSTTNCIQTQTGVAVVIINPKPTASFTISTPFCTNKDVTFTPSSSISTGNIVQWVWDYGDGNGTVIRTDNNPFVVNYATAGIKVVTFKTISDKGCESALFTQSITINNTPIAGFIDPEVCLQDATAQFTDTSSVVGGSIVFWEWNFGDVGSPTNVVTGSTPAAQNPTHTYTTTGPKTVTLIVTTNTGCKATKSQTFTVNGSVPVAGFTVLNSANLCSNTAVQIQDNSVVNVGSTVKVQIIWDNVAAPTVIETDDVPTPNEIYSHNYPALQTDQTYTIRYLAYSGATCVDDFVQTITVHATPLVSFGAIPDVCLNNGTVQLTQATVSGTVSGPPGGSYSGVGVSPSGVFNPITAGVGTHTITYTYTSSFGCTDVKTSQVKVLEAPVANFAPVLPTCQNGAITFNQSSTSNAGTITQWIYNWGDGSPIQTFTDGNPKTHTYTTAGSVTATLTVVTGDGCNSLPKPVTFTVNPQPQPNFTFTNNACLPQANIQFTNTTPNLSDWTYSWNFNVPSTSPNEMSTAINPSHIYTNVGPFDVQLVATSGLTGCSNTVIKSVNTIKPAPVASFAFSVPSICEAQTVTLIDQSLPTAGSLSNWQWSYGDNTNVTTGQTQPPHLYSTAGTYNVKLTVTNSFGCVDDTIRTYRVYPYPTVNAGADGFVLEGGVYTLQGVATGNNLTYLWTGTPAPANINNNTLLQPLAQPINDITYRLTVTAEGGCSRFDEVFIKVLKFPQIPNTFTPNNDGVHDTWEIKYLFTYPQNRVQVFTRTGQLVFESRGYNRPWDGTKNGQALPFDTYYYIIEPGNGRKPITGYVTIVK
ncbi:PKD domain-containing protein [Ferruginibacter yonginensis]|uniref:PKD domain-containing protein n=1 Tax=Ferruginibacter yonginensis TaxID=1310416 RepID=A0ABV8QNX6_9BACT